MFVTIHFPKDGGKELRTENVCEQDCNLQLCLCAFINKLAYTALRSAQQTHWPIHVNRDGSTGHIGPTDGDT